MVANDVRDFSKRGDAIAVPTLTSVQRDAYQRFLQLEVPLEKRDPATGLEALLREVFPIESYDGTMRLEYLYYKLDEARYTPDECRELRLTYGMPFRIGVRLVREGVSEIPEEEIYLGEIPIMMGGGEFIVNGAERVIVNQLHRSPGVDFGIATAVGDRPLHSARIIPERGSWIELEVTKKDVLAMRIDQSTKIAATTFLRALDENFSSTDRLLDLFYKVEAIKLEKLQPEHYTAEPIYDEDGVELRRAGAQIGDAIEKILAQDWKTIRVITSPGDPLILNTIAEERLDFIGEVSEYEAGLLKIYGRLRPGNPPQVEKAKSLFNEKFFDENRYRLGKVGRFRINRKFDATHGYEPAPEGLQHIRAEDFLAVVRYIMDLRAKRNRAHVDDIDHLGNRRLRTLDELAIEEMRKGFLKLRRTVQERMSIKDPDELSKIADLVNSKSISSAIEFFFGRSELSQVVDQTNPLSMLVHERRLSALGPGGLNRKRAGFEVRDVHISHYGRICPIETPEGTNIGLIASLGIYAKIDEYGFLLTPYREVKGGKATGAVEFLRADQEMQDVLATSDVLNGNGRITAKQVLARMSGDLAQVAPENVQYVDISPKQIVGVSAALIPFLEHDDANRALMGSNMQRQSVPLIMPEPPLVATGMEQIVGDHSGMIVKTRRGGVVTFVDADRVVIDNADEYELRKFVGLNERTCQNQKPVVRLGQRVKADEIIADGASTTAGELSIGKNVLVAFNTFDGYNFEDAIVISERLVKEDIFTSIHIESFDVEIRETKLGQEEFTRDIPNVSEKMLRNLDEHGVIRTGARVGPGDILVGKVSPKSKAELTPEEKLLHAIFGRAGEDVKNDSLEVPAGTEGIVIGARRFSRRMHLNDEQKRRLKREMNEYEEQMNAKAITLFRQMVTQMNEATGSEMIDPSTRQKVGASDIPEVILEQIENFDPKWVKGGKEAREKALKIRGQFWPRIEAIEAERERKVAHMKRGDELPSGVLEMVKVYLATRRQLSVGDKMAGRHGNKGVIARIVPEEDMPFMADGTPVDVLLNPLGVPSRMNVGQILEAHLGWAAKVLGFQAVSPVFDGASEQEVLAAIDEANQHVETRLRALEDDGVAPDDPTEPLVRIRHGGKVQLYDGRTGQPFHQKSSLGYMYLLKLHHLVDDKIHARATGPYSLITQQPLGGKARTGGQRFGEMEVWALEGYGAAYVLQELLTVKSDDVEGRTKIYDSMVKGTNTLEAGMPVVFDVLCYEIRGLGLNITLEKQQLEGASLLKESSKLTTMIMNENVYDRVNDYGSVKITLASPNDIRSWSFGEVKKPETINYRTYRPEKDGLFCERIFGPERDYECACGKYKGTKYKGIICDRCGVKVTHSRVRRKRMGHINLAAPIIHIWFFKALPSRLGTLLAMKTSDLEKIIYFQDYVIIDPGTTDLQARQVVTEDEYRAAVEKHGSSAFKALMGAEAVRELLYQLNLDDVAQQLRDDLDNTRSKQKIKDISKRLKLVEQIRHSENDPAWMVMDVVPVIPPDLRPLVLLESGNFATSDLNDLYRRIINRNNRLKKLMDLNAPEVIIRNEKRMLQQAVDALFDNGRCRRPVLGSSNRPLKSLTDMIKGKQGRFRENLLGKRVDYSARSVIVVGPELKLHQCGLPKKIALELFQPFIIRKLKEHGLADTIKSAKRMLERRDPEVWDILEQVIYQHPVMLNRAPTLHRMGIQAFEPVLVEGNAIMIHPLVCAGYNADFDGDQMAVHLPLSVEAQAETHVLMLSTHNIFSPAHGNPIVSPSQDIVMGVYFLTVVNGKMPDQEKGLPRFRDPHEAILARDHDRIQLQQPIVVRLEGFDEVVGAETEAPRPVPKHRRVITTVGRILFCDVLDPGLPFYNCPLGVKGCSRVIDDTYARAGRPATLRILDDMKELGFKVSTKSGLSIGITDIRIPANKRQLIEETQKKVDRVERNYQAGAITERERHNQLLDLWAHCREQVTKSLVETLRNDRRNPADLSEVPIDSRDGEPYLNPVFLMSTSGARGNISQMQQLAGMRGLMAKPSGEIIETPIRANFREGLNVLEYFSSTHGARKGLADTALKTADSGYLTRKLYDVAQSVVVLERDCGTSRGITKRAIYKGEEVDVPLRDVIVGRTSLRNIVNPITDRKIVGANEVITVPIAEQIEALGIDSVQVRSALTCETGRGVCALCYGTDMSTGQRVEEGLAVGTIAAQSIGEPGTQLTMRTFHTGGIAARGLVENAYKANFSGTVELRECNEIEVEVDGEKILTALKRNGELVVLDDKARELEKYKVPYGAGISVATGAKVRKGQTLVEWDPHRTPILAEKSGTVRFKDIDIDDTVREEQAKGGRKTELIVVEHTGEKHPQIIIEDAQGTILDFHHLPAKARIEVQESDTVQAGQMLARQPKEVTGSADIVGGLPRVTEVFEARTPKDPAVMAEISGRVELYSDKRKGKMTIRVISDSGQEIDHHVPQGKHLLVHTGDHVRAGDPLTEGPLIPHDILNIKGEEDLYIYMLEEVQNVYRAQGVPLSDKHIEVILRQMLSKVRVLSPGDTDLLPNEVVDKFHFRERNAEVAGKVRISEPGDTSLAAGSLVERDELKETNALAEAEGKAPARSKRARPARARTLLLGITKASLQAESFLSGASFQETTKVLTEASLRGAVDDLQGLKENVLLGHLIPAGTGFDPYQKIRVARLVEPPVTEAEEEQAMLAEAAEAAEALGAERVPTVVEVMSSSDAEPSVSDG